MSKIRYEKVAQQLQDCADSALSDTFCQNCEAYKGGKVSALYLQSTLLDATKAIRELMAKTAMLEHLKHVSYEDPSSQMLGDIVAFYDDRHISEAEVQHCIYNGKYNANILRVRPEQAKNVFGIDFEGQLGA